MAVLYVRVPDELAGMVRQRAALDRRSVTQELIMLIEQALKLTLTPIGYQGAAQHTYTPGCDGFHEPGPCP